MFNLAFIAVVVFLFASPPTVKGAATTPNCPKASITVTCSNKTPLGVGFNPGCIPATGSTAKPSILVCAVPQGSAAGTPKTLQCSEGGTVAVLATVACKTSTAVDPKAKALTYACETAAA